MTLRLIDRKTGEVAFDGQRVSRACPCPICGHLHKNQSWCLVDKARGLTICPRVESRRRIGDAGWLHGDGAERHEAVMVCRQKAIAAIDFGDRWKSAAVKASIESIERLASALSLPVASVAAIDIGVEGGSWVFPMWSNDGQCCGLKVRTSDGRKLCATGSRIGVMKSKSFDARKASLVITEGESDLMVAAAWGFNAVARAGCQSCVQQLTEMARAKDVLIIADNDAAGKDGAAKLGKAMGNRAKSVIIVEPPVKDLRAWAQSGATKVDLLWRVKSKRGY